MKQFCYTRHYVGSVKAVILDWCGTVVDKYSLAPIAAFRELFETFKCPISISEARADMGIRKDLHIAAILAKSEVQKRWLAAYGRHPSQQDVEEMFRAFVPVQLRMLPVYSTLLPGTVQATHQLRHGLGCKIGMSTGFYRGMAEILLKEAQKQGFQPDAEVTGDEVKNGSRPNPHMLYRNLDLMDVAPIQAVVKADDSTDGVREGLNAGCWAVGIARYSTYMNIDSQEHENTLSEMEIQTRLEKARNVLSNTGAHYVIDTITDLPEVVANINSRLAKGEKP